VEHKLLILTSFFVQLIKDMKSGPATSQQSLARVLSVINYDKYPTMLPKGIEYLLESVKPKVRKLFERICVCDTTQRHFTVQGYCRDTAELLRRHTAYFRWYYTPHDHL